VKANFEFGDFFYMKDEIAMGYMRGDYHALERAKRDGKMLAERWLKWLATQSGELITPAIRFDFFVQYI